MQSLGCYSFWYGLKYFVEIRFTDNTYTDHYENNKSFTNKKCERVEIPTIFVFSVVLNSINGRSHF